MRAAPLAFVLDPAISGQRLAIRDICRITHHNDEAYAGALAIVVALRHCVGANRVPSDLLRHVLDHVPDTAVRDRLELLAEFKGTPEAAAAHFGNTGYVVDAVPLALYIAITVAPATAEHAIRTAVSVGGDTDTIASLTGQITGAAGGLAPLELWRRLPDHEVLQASIERFVLLL